MTSHLFLGWRSIGVERTLGVGEVDDVAVLLEHVDLLNGLDGLGVQLLEGSLELPVVGAGASGRALCLPAGSTLATMSICQSNCSPLVPKSSSSSFVIVAWKNTYPANC